MDETRRSDEPVNPDVAYEASDVSASAVILFGATLFVSTVVIYVVIWWIFGYLAEREHRAEKRGFTVQYVPKDLPPAPQLEALTRGRPDVAGLAARTPPDAYGWVDRKAGIVRVPVQRAAALLAGRLPAEGKELKP